MNRRKQRELSFLLLFENLFTGYSLQEIEDNKLLSSDFDEKGFNELVITNFNGVLEHKLEIDNLIEENSLKWGKDRLSKVVLTVLRLAIFEMLFRKDIPISVTINEAVELSKKYGADKEASFVNGILGAVSRTLEKNSEVNSDEN